MKTGELQPVASPLSLNWIIFLSLLPLPRLENGGRWGRRGRNRGKNCRFRGVLSPPPPPFSFPPFLPTIKILLRECTSRNLLPLALPSASPSPLPGSPRVGQRERERKQKFFASLSFSLSILGARIQNSVEKKKKGWCGLYSVSGLGFFQFGGIKGVKRM